MNGFAVCHLGNRVDRVYVAGLRELARSPLVGIIGAIAFCFDGRRLELVRVRSFERPTKTERWRA